MNHGLSVASPMTAGCGGRLRYRVEGMDCPSCGSAIEKALARLPGVESAEVAYAAQSLNVGYSASMPDSVAIEDTVRSLGFKASRLLAAPGAAAADPHAAHGENDGQAHGDAEDGPVWKTRKALLTLGLGAGLALALAASWVLPQFVQTFGYRVPVDAALYGVVVLAGVAPFAKRAWTLARLGTPFSIETLMAVAALGALAIGESVEAAIVVFLFSVGELLENVAAGRARAGIRALVGLVPRTALVEEDGGARTVSVDDLRIGQIVLARPGDRVPADGEILSGETSIDESQMTGESAPVSRGVGQQAFAGTINLTGAIRLRVTRTSADNTIARIVRLVEQAQESKSPTARFIDRFSRWYTPLAMAAAALTIVVPPLAFGGDWYTWLYRGLSLLLIACPCALVLSTPAAIASGLAAGARRGLLVKGGAALEAMGKVTTVAFDKTGTLTEGRPQVTDVVEIAGSVDDALRLAASLEAASGHPLGKAIVAEAERRKLALSPAPEAIAIGGKAVVGVVDGRRVVVGSPRYALELGLFDEKAIGAAATLEEAGKTVVAIVVDDALLALVAVRDELRTDAKDGVAALRALGVKAVMLTGDNRRTGAAIAQSLDMDVRSELLPEDKLAEIGKLRAQGMVAMVGDGVNDAPALAAATIGVAMGAGTDVALETADIALTRNSVKGVAQLVRLSRATLANIRQNVTVAVGLKAVFLVTTMLGATTMWMAILADTGATVLVTLNALRLLRFR